MRLITIPTAILALAAVSGEAPGPSRVTVLNDDFRHNGRPLHTGANERLVIRGHASGAGSYSGSGTLVFSGAFSPGNSPAMVTLAPQVHFSPDNVLTMEIGGRNPGPGNPVNDGYDRLVFTSAADPQVAWGGALVVELINGFGPRPGDSFLLFDFDPARTTGSFSTITVIDHDLLAPDAGLDFSELYETGIVRVVKVPIVADLSGQAVSRTRIVVNASVDPGGLCTAWAEYGTTPLFGSQTAPIELAGSGPVPATMEITGLQPLTTYFVRVRAANGAGDTASSPALQLTTLATRYEEWAFDELGDAAAPKPGDHDSDAFTNFDEYALALFPFDPDVHEPRIDFFDYPDGPHLRLQFWRHIDRDDIVIEVQASSDLDPDNWITMAASSKSDPFTGPGFVFEDRSHPLTEPGIVEVRVPEPAASATRRFLRINITSEP